MSPGQGYPKAQTREDASGWPAHRSPEPEPARRDPFARRLIVPPVNTTTDPLLIVRTVLAAGRSAGLPFDAAWPVAAEAALSYLSRRNAEDWWAALDGTATAWASAYAGERSRLAELHG